MKKTNLFIIISCIFLTFMVTFYGGRMIYYYQKSKQLEKVGEVRLAEVIKNKSYDSSIQVEGDSLYYQGNVLNNYVYYGNRYFRIIGMENNQVILVDDISTILPFQETFENSDIKSFLENVYLVSLPEYEKYLANGEICLDQECNNRKETLVGLLSIQNYEKANNQGNYLNNQKYYWLSDGSYVDKSGNIQAHSDGIYGVRPVIRLQTDVAYFGGTGTYYDPYFINLEDALSFATTEAKPIAIGSYIKYSDKLWKVVDSKDTFKLVLQESIGKFAYSTQKNEFDLSDKTSIAYYLNHTFLDSLDKTYMVEGNFDVGAFENSYMDQQTKQTKAYVGLLQMGDLFLTDANDYLLLTSTGKKNTVYKVMDGMLYADDYTKENDIRPVIHISKNVKIEEGYGTEESPFVVGEA